MTSPITEATHLEMMRRPERWPHWPVLPLQHKTRREPDGSMRLLGFMLADATGKGAAPKVYVGLIFFQTMGQKLADLPVEEFVGLEAVVAAGWEVN